MKRYRHHAFRLPRDLAAACLLALAPAASGAAPPSDEDGEAQVRVSVLDNGSFAEPGARETDEDGILRIPWWSSSHGVVMLGRDEDRTWLTTRGAQWASQPIPSYEPLVHRTSLRGRVRGRGRLEIADGSGGLAVFEVEGPPGEFAEFSLDAANVAERLGRDPRPRLTLTLRAADESPEGADWTDLEAWAFLPAPSEEDLREEIAGELRWIFRLWLERGLDREGEVASGFLCHLHDVLTGERLQTFDGGFNPLHEQLLRAVEVEDDPEWRAALDDFVGSYLELGLHPGTGLPRLWNPISDEPRDQHGVEIALPLGLLVDLAERGPERWRERALAAAVRIGEQVLEHGVLPDGNVAPRYRPADGRPDTAAPPIRRLDVPAQLGRLARTTGDERFLDVARRAVARLEYTHYWAGTWNLIDPGFDDNFGYYGARAVTLWESHPDVPAFQNLARSGFDYYAAIWPDALRLGGSIAADQVRCWKMLRDMARLDPEVARRTPALLDLAVRSHFKSEQYPNGAWGDVTHYRFDPRIDLVVGDVPGIPQNLVVGLAAVYEEELGLRTDEIRGMFTAVLRSTIERSKREYGYLSTSSERSGGNPAGGSIRLADGLVDMLRRLSESN